MSSYEERFESYKAVIGREIPPLFGSVAANAGLTPEQQQHVGEALGLAFMAGVEAGENELLGIAAARGLDLQVERIPSPNDQ